MSTMKQFAAVGLVLLILGSSLLGVRLLWPEQTLATCDLGDGHSLRIWTRHDSMEIDPPGPSLYYCVTRGSTVIVPETRIGVKQGQFDFRTIVTKDGQITCVCGEQEPHFLHCVIVFDHRTQESWPQREDLDNAGRPTPKGRWVEFLKKAARDNLDEPCLRDYVATE